MGMDDGVQAAASFLGRLKGGQELIGVHHVSVAARTTAGLARSSDVVDGRERQRPVGARKDQPAAFVRVRGAGMGRDLAQGQIHGGGRYRSARSANKVTTTPRP